MDSKEIPLQLRPQTTSPLSPPQVSESLSLAIGCFLLGYWIGRKKTKWLMQQSSQVGKDLGSFVVTCASEAWIKKNKIQKTDAHTPLSTQPESVTPMA
ncbi:MAG: hypothetical protein ACO3A2_01450 [Bdellovibrionia bacterium]